MSFFENFTHRGRFMGATRPSTGGRGLRRSRAWLLLALPLAGAVATLAFLESRLPSFEYDPLPPAASAEPLPLDRLSEGARRMELELETLPAARSVSLPTDVAVRMRSIRIHGPVRSLWLDSEEDADFGDVDAILRDVLRETNTDAARAEAIWRFMMDASVHGPRPLEAIHGNFDPLHHLTSYGYSHCANSASTLAYLWERAGLPARIWDLPDHVAAEVYYDGSWHLLDADERVAFRDPASGEILGLEELREHPERVALALDPHGRGPRGHRLARLQEIFATEAALDASYRVKHATLEQGDLRRLLTRPSYLADLYRHFRLHTQPPSESVRIRLRDGEEMRLYWEGEPERFVLPGPYTAFEPAEDGGTSSRRPRPRRGSGSLLTPLAAVEPTTAAGIRREGRLVWGPGAGRASWSVESPFIITNASLRGLRRGTEDGGGRIEVRPRGGEWQAAGELAGPDGPFVLNLAPLDSIYRPQVIYAYEVRLELDTPQSTPGELQDLVLQTDVQLNPAALPRLRPGTNQLEFRGEAAPGKPVRIELGWDDGDRPLPLRVPGPPPEDLVSCLDLDPDPLGLAGQTPSSEWTAVNLEPRRLSQEEDPTGPMEYVTVREPGLPARLELRLPTIEGLALLQVGANVEAWKPLGSATIDIRAGEDGAWISVWEKGDSPYPEVYPENAVEVLIDGRPPAAIRWVLEARDAPGPEIRLVRVRVQGFCTAPAEAGAQGDGAVSSR